MINIWKFLNGLRIIPRSSSAADTKGELEVIDSTGKLGYHNGSSVSPMVTEAHSATLSNKTLDNTTIATIKDTNLTIQDDSDITKQLKFQVSGIATGTTRTLTAPDANTIIVGTDATQTLTNKTLSGNTATNLISGSGTLTLNTSGTITVPNATDTLVGRDTTDTLTNKTLTNPTINGATISTPTLTVDDNSFTVRDNVDNTKQVKFEVSSVSTATTRTLTAPDADTTIVGTDATQTLTNKTLTAPIISTISNTGTITLPTSTDTLVGRNTTDTLTNKTLTSPTINTPSISTPTITGTIEADNITSADIGTSNSATTINIGTGTSASNVINVGGVNSTINMYGTVNNQNVTNLNVTDKLITINDGGAAGSGGNSGFEIEENGSATGYVQTSSDRNSFNFKAPNTNGITSLTPGASNDTVTLNAATQTLTNKTLTSPIISTISNTGTITLPTSTDTLVGRATTDTLTNKTLVDNSTVIADNTDNSKQIKFDAGGTTSTSTTITAAQTANRVVTLPNATTTLVGTDTTDTLTNKTLTSPTINTPTIDIITLDGQTSTPSNPSSGFYKAYVKDSDGKLRILNSAGSETTVGSGSGGINYITNFDFESDTTGWATYADAAGTSPVDGTGGSPNITFTRTTSSPLRGTGSGLITKDAANRQGEGVSYDFTIDSADKSKQLSIQFDYEASANYTDSSGTEYMVIYVYDVTNATQIPVSFLSSSAPQGSGSQKITFDATTSTSYRLEFHIAGTGTSAWTYKIDNVKVSPQEITLSAAVSDWISYTPTFSAGFGTPTNIDFKYARIGQNIKIRGSFTCGTTTTGAATISIPSGLTIDSNFRNASNEKYQFGYYTVGKNAGTNPISNTDYTIGGIYNSFNSTTNFQLDARSNTSGGGNDNTNTILATSDVVMIQELTIPIANWSSNIQLNNSRVEYASNSGMGDADDTTNFVNDPNGNLIPATTYTATRKKRVRFKNPIQTSDSIIFQVKPDSGNSDWMEINGWTFDINDSNRTIAEFHDQGGTQYGIGGFLSVSGSKTDLDVNFGRYRYANSGTYAAAGVDYSAGATMRWRVVKYSNAVPVEQAAINSEVIVDSGNGHGSTTGTKIRRFSNIRKNVGNGITYADSSTDGGSFTINEAGIYTISYSDGLSSGESVFGITVNDTAKTTNWTTPLTYAQGARAGTSNNAGFQGFCSWTGRLSVGDVVRAHDNGNLDFTNSFCMFSICKVSN